MKRGLWERIDATGDCWEWTGSRTVGYGMMQVDGIRRVVHRLVWEQLVGPIPDGLVLDHLCRVRHCVNPDHLEVVTPIENVRRGYGPTARYGRATHCDAGHPYTEENTFIRGVSTDGRPFRRCRICKRAYFRKYQRERRNAA